MSPRDQPLTNPKQVTSLLPSSYLPPEVQAVWTLSITSWCSLTFQCRPDTHLTKCSCAHYPNLVKTHYTDVIMGAIAFQITSLTIVYSTVYSGADQRNIKAPRHWPLWGEVIGHRWIPRTNGQLRGKCFHLMTSSWHVAPKCEIIICVTLGDL